MPPPGVDISHPDVTALVENASGQLLVGTFGWGLNVRPTGSSRLEPLPIRGVREDVGTVTSMAAARKGTTWFGTTTALVEIDPTGRSLAFFRHDPKSAAGIGAGYVTALREDRQGRLWVGTGGGGLHRLSASGASFERFVHDPARLTASGGQLYFSANGDDSVGEPYDHELWAMTIVVDADGDGVPDASDCAPNNPAVWAVPGEVGTVTASKSGGAAVFQWSPPASPGGALPLYDTVRSTVASDFSTDSCVETRDGSDTASSDPGIPSAAFYYLVRAENACGVGSAGRTSSNAERVVAACP